MRKFRQIICVLSALFFVFGMMSCGLFKNKDGNGNGTNNKPPLVRPEPDPDPDPDPEPDPDPDPDPEPDDGEKFVIGAWMPYFGDGSQAQFDEIAAAGFNLLIPMSFQTDFNSDPSAAKTILDRAHVAGMKVMVQDSGLSTQGVWNTSRVNNYRAHPAFMGNYIADEPEAAEFYGSTQWIKTKWEAYKQLFPQRDKRFYVNLHPDWGNWSGQGNGHGAANYKQYLDRYLAMNPDYLSFDTYALMEDNTIRNTWFLNLEETRHAAKDKGIPLWAFSLSLQHAFVWEYGKPHAIRVAYRKPNQRELRWQMAVNMTYGVSAVQYFAYYSVDASIPGDEVGDALIDLNGQKTSIYYDTKVVNNEVLKWGDIYMGFDWQGTAAIVKNGAAPNSNAMFNLLEKKVSVSSIAAVDAVTSTQDILMGIFKDADGADGFMVTNATNPYNNLSASVTVKFASGYNAVKVYAKGVESVIPLNASNQAVIPLESGEGKFLIPLAQ